MNDIELMEIVRGAIYQINETDKSTFSIEDIQAQDVRLETFRSREIDRILLQLRKHGERLYPAAIGTDGCHLWSFGYKPIPKTKRRPIGRR